MSTKDLERRSVYSLPPEYWINYRLEDRDAYLVPLYDAVLKALEVRGADTDPRGSLAVAQALGLEVVEDADTLWVSSDTADLIADSIFRWEVASLSTLEDAGLGSLYPLDLRSVPANTDELVEAIGNEIDPDGFIGRLKCEKVFDAEKAERYLYNLTLLEVEASISLDLAKLIWSLPVLLKWQLDWAEPGSGYYKQIDDVLNRTVNILDDLIGFP